MSSLAEQYRALRRAQSASMIYNEPAQRPAPVRIYEDRPYSLEQYQNKKADPLEQKPGESFTAYSRRLGALARALPDGEVERRLEAATKLASEESWSWEAQRADFDGRVGSSGVMGNSDPRSRAAALGHRGFGERVLAGQGHLAVEPISAGHPASMVEIRAVMQQREQERLGQQPQRPVAPTGSSGEGWTVSR